MVERRPAVVDSRDRSVGGESAGDEESAVAGEGATLRTVVVVRDEELRSVLELQFELEGHDVAVLRDGERCLEHLADCDVLPDAVLLDEHLPRADGETVARTILDRYGDECSVFLLRGSGEVSDAPIGTIEKPMDPTALTARVERDR